MVYPAKHLEPVRILTIMQLVFGVVITLFQVITTAIDDHFHESLSKLRTATNNEGFLAGEPFLDIGGTGIWVGAMIILAASLGICGYRNQNRCLIIVHLVLNALSLLVTFPALSVTSITIGTLNFCKISGLRYFRNLGRYGSTPPPVTFYGEVIYGSTGSFHCNNVMFTVWKALDGVMAAGYVVEIIITIMLLVYNSLALCLCCRKCCVCYPPTNEDEPHMSYSNLRNDTEQAQQRLPAQMATPIQSGMQVQALAPQPQTVQSLQPVQQTAAVPQTRPVGEIVYQVPVVSQPQRIQLVQRAAPQPAVQQFQPIQQVPVSYPVQQVNQGFTSQPVLTTVPTNMQMPPQGGAVQQVGYAPQQRLQPQMVSSTGQPLSEEAMVAIAIAASEAEAANSGEKLDESARETTHAEGGRPNLATED